MPRTLAAIIGAQIKKIIKLDEKYYTAIIDPKNIQTVYVLIRNLPDDYKNGEYFYKLHIPEEFPDKAPSFYALTPNGVFELGGQICISIGTFHQTDFVNNKHGTYGWRPAIGLSGFILNGIVNAMLHFDSSDKGIRINIETSENKQKKAKESIEYNNKHYSYIKNLFDSLKESNSNLKVWN